MNQTNNQTNIHTENQNSRLGIRPSLLFFISTPTPPVPPPDIFSLSLD